jgi:competence protein ComEC
MKRPLIPVALLYVSGILLAGLPMPLTALFGVAFNCGLLCLVWSRARRVLLGALLVTAGWVNLAQRTAILSPHDLRAQFGTGDPEELVSIRGVLRETPYYRSYEIRNQKVWSTMARLDVSEVRLAKGDWQPAYGRVMSRTKKLLPASFFAGQTVEIRGWLSPARRPLAEGLFDYREYLDHQGIYFQLSADEPASWQMISTPPRPPLAVRFCAWARAALAMGLPAEDESLRLEWALTLGWKEALTDQVAAPFIHAATYHIFAVDGLRIAIVAGILLALLRVLSVPRALCGLLAVPLILFYAALTGWPASAIRAIVMIMVVFGGWIFHRPSDLINSLFAAALIILAWEPRELFEAGFQLSFFVVLCIILILPFFNRAGEYLLRPDPMLPASLRPSWQKALQMPLRFVIDLFLTSLAAWLGSIPLVAWYFHILTPLSGAANMLAVPLCALVLVCNLASLLLAGWFAYAAVLFNHAGWFFMECIRVTSNWCAHWPGAYFYVPMPGLFTIALYYLLLLTTLTGWLFAGNRKTWKIAGVGSLAVVWCALWLWERPRTRLTVLPLNGGHSVYVSDADGWNDWLIDCGNQSAVETVVGPFLQAQGVNRLANLLLTHGEIDYSGGAQTVSDMFHPRNLYASAIHFRSPEYRKFTTGGKTQPDWKPPLKSGDEAGRWTVLYPPPQTRLTRADDNVLVLRGDLRGTRVLLLSDLSHAGQNALLAAAPDLRADIVIASLPGDGEPLSDALLDAVRPRVIIVADSQLPASKRAGAKLKQRLGLRHTVVCYTSETDAITLSIRSNGWDLRTMDGTKLSSANSNNP